MEVEFTVSQFSSSLIPLFVIQLLNDTQFQVGPIPINDGIGKEIATQITTTIKNNKTFYTDSSGRDFIKRVCHIINA